MYILEYSFELFEERVLRDDKYRLFNVEHVFVQWLVWFNFFSYLYILAFCLILCSFLFLLFLLLVLSHHLGCFFRLTMNFPLISNLTLHSRLRWWGLVFELWDLQGFETLLVGGKGLLNLGEVLNESQRFSIDTWSVCACKNDIWETILWDFSFL